MNPVLVVIIAAVVILVGYVVSLSNRLNRARVKID